jgi:leucine-zipper-like transcriptional regulator 1
LIICGGMGHKAESGSHDDLRVLNDVRFFNLATRRWLPAALTNSTPDPADFRVPKARYAHLSSITADRLFIIGGQDLSNIWLDDVHVYDLLGKTWVERRSYPRHVGTYRSIAVAAEKRVRLPQEELRASQSTSTLGPPGTRFRTDNAPPSSPQVTQSDSLVHLPYTAPATDEYPNDIYLYSNYNVSFHLKSYKNDFHFQ